MFDVKYGVDLSYMEWLNLEREFIEDSPNKKSTSTGDSIA